MHYHFDSVTCTFPAGHPRRKLSRAEPAATQGNTISQQWYALAKDFTLKLLGWCAQILWVTYIACSSGNRKITFFSLSFSRSLNMYLYWTTFILLLGNCELPARNLALHFTGPKVKVVLPCFKVKQCFSFSNDLVFPGCDTHSEPSAAHTADLSATPPQILQLHPPIQFIAIPDTPGYPIVPLSFSPSVIGLPIPKAAVPPTFIFGGCGIVAVIVHTELFQFSLDSVDCRNVWQTCLYTVPATSPPTRQYVAPLSPGWYPTLSSQLRMVVCNSIPVFRPLKLISSLVL